MTGRSTTIRRIQPPSWEANRPFLTGSALRDTAVPRGSTTGGPDLSALPLQTQEQLAAEDALFALLGVRTSFLEHYVSAEGHVVFSSETARAKGADPHIVPLLAKILPLANHYNVVREFVEETRIATSAGGFVKQAIGVALSELLCEYRAFVLRLEEELRAGKLPLQRLVYHVQPSLRSMSLLRSIVDATRELRGGAALDAVYKLSSSFVGAEELRDVLVFVIDRVAAPMLAMVDAWVLRGVIEDPHSEFFVREDTSHASGASARDPTSSRFWVGRYTVDTGNLPTFLAPFVENVLRAGKYLNVLRECNVDVARAVARKTAEERARHAGSALAPLLTPGPDGITHLRLSGDELLGPDAARRIGALVNHCFAVASRALMEYLHEEVMLVARLRSLRRYFLLEQGDFLVHFFDAAHNELSKQRDRVSKTRLASLLELSVRTSVNAADPYHDDLTIRLHSEDVASQVMLITGSSSFDAKGRSRGLETLGAHNATVLSGYDAFSLDYRLKWPMKLIVSDIEMLKYQLISRYLLHCKRVERELENCWRNHAQVKGAMRMLRSHFARSFALRNRMLQFVRNMLYYTLADVLEPNWRKLTTGIAKADTLDEIIQQHGAFLDTSLRECLVSNDKHLKVFYAITQVCLLFSGYTERFCRTVAQGGDPEETVENMRKHNYQVTVAKFETRFDTNLRTLMDGLSAMSKKRASSHLANLCECLDVGGFYERSAVLASAAYGASS